MSQKQWSHNIPEERKYREEEVKEIFDLAASMAEAEQPTASDQGGLTLAELQEVALEVGVEPSQIAKAARTLETRQEVLPRRTSLGMPISVGRVIELPRAVTDREWDILVTEFRETFGARGRVRSQGGVREWANGNLMAVLEPTETGHRLRLKTHKGSFMALNRMGGVGLAIGLSLFTIMMSTRISPVFMELAMMLLIGIGGGALALNMVNLPRWASEREEQMKYLAGRVRALLAEQPQGEEAQASTKTPTGT